MQNTTERLEDKVWEISQKAKEILKIKNIREKIRKFEDQTKNYNIQIKQYLRENRENIGIKIIQNIIQENFSKLKGTSFHIERFR